MLGTEEKRERETREETQRREREGQASSFEASRFFFNEVFYQLSAADVIFPALAFADFLSPLKTGAGESHFLRCVERKEQERK